MKAISLLLLVLSLAFPLRVGAAESIAVATGDSTNAPRQPQAAIDAKGGIHVVYGIRDSVLYARSDDGGKSFGAPVKLPAPDARVMSLGMRRGPRIAATGKGLCVTAIGGKEGKGRDGDLLAWRSKDGGASWQTPVVVNDVEGSAREGLHAMAGSGDGGFACAWLDLRNGKTEVMFAGSTDGGESWSKNVRVYRSPDGSVCECCHPSIAHDSKGRIFVQWRNSLAGARDIYVASSSDKGATFGKAVKLGVGGWMLDACPMDGGAIAAIGPGEFASVWRKDGAVYLLSSGKQIERLLGDGEQPWIAGTNNGPFVVWLKSRGDALYLQSPTDRKPQKLAERANDPMIAAGTPGSQMVVAVWEDKDGDTHTIRCRVVAPTK